VTGPGLRLAWRENRGGASPGGSRAEAPASAADDRRGAVSGDASTLPLAGALRDGLADDLALPAGEGAARERNDAGPEEARGAGIDGGHDAGPHANGAAPAPSARAALLHDGPGLRIEAVAAARYPIRAVEAPEVLVTLEGEWAGLSPADTDRALRGLARAAARGEAEGRRRLEQLGASDGEFLLALVDKRDRSWTVQTDALGRVPLYAVAGGDAFRLSRSLAALAAETGAPVDPVGLAQTLFLGHALGERTLFRDVFRIPPGACVHGGPGSPPRVEAPARRLFPDAGPPPPAPAESASGDRTAGRAGGGDRDRWDVPGARGVPDARDVPDARGISDARGAPGARGVPGARGAPDARGVSDARGAPGAGGVPEASGASGASGGAAIAPAAPEPSLESAAAMLAELLVSACRGRAAAHPAARSILLSGGGLSSAAVAAALRRAGIPFHSTPFDPHRPVLPAVAPGDDVLFWSAEGAGPLFSSPAAPSGRGAHDGLRGALARTPHLFSLAAAARIARIPERRLLESIAAELARHGALSDPARAARLLRRQRVWRYHFEREDALRARRWIAAPFWSLPFVRAALDLPEAWKQEDVLALSLLNRLDPAHAAGRPSDRKAWSESGEERAAASRRLWERFPAAARFLRQGDGEGPPLSAEERDRLETALGRLEERAGLDAAEARKALGRHPSRRKAGALFTALRALNPEE